MARWLLNGPTLMGSFAVGVALALVMTIPARAQPYTQCTLATAVQEVHSVSELPPKLLKLVSPIADIGAPWNMTDSVSDPTLPFKRLIRAGYRETDWFLWYEHGGIGYSQQVVVARVLPNSAIAVLANGEIGPVTPNPACSFIDGVFAGQVPPYPQGTWPASGYY